MCGDVFLWREIESQDIKTLSCSKWRRVVIFSVFWKLLIGHNCKYHLNHRYVQFVLHNCLLFKFRQSSQECDSFNSKTVIEVLILTDSNAELYHGFNMRHNYGHFALNKLIKYVYCIACFILIHSCKSLNLDHYLRNELLKHVDLIRPRPPDQMCQCDDGVVAH